MTPLRPAAPPPRPELRRRLRAALAHLGRPLRVLAEDLLGLDAAIDLVAVDPGGGVVLVLVGEEGEDLELVANGLAQRAWLEPRLRDWRKLAPELEIRPERGVGLLLLAPDFGSRALAAARGAGPGGPQLARYRFVEELEGGQPAQLVLESVHLPEAASGRAVAAGEAAAGAAPGPQGAAAPGRAGTSAFRTGLAEEDLRPLRARTASRD